MSNFYNLALDANWELDLWGRVRRNVESNEASAQASVADLEAAKLSAQADLAQNYFLLRVQDAQIDLLATTAAAYEKSLQLTQKPVRRGRRRQERRRAGGNPVQGDAGAGARRSHRARAARARDRDPDRQAAGRILDRRGADRPRVSRHSGRLPSELLERRPDIAAAERRIAAANAQIGVAQAAFFPTLTLSATGGFAASSFANWLTAPARYWSLGPALLAQTIFDAGLRSAQKEQAIAIYDETVATYRQTVLTGFQEVEDNLAALRMLGEEAGVQDDAVKAAREAVTIVNNQYRAGTVNYLAVVVIQAGALNNERTALGIRGRRLTASVALIKALGGGWNATALAQQ